MHLADEYALISAEIRRLKARQAGLRVQMISDVQSRVSNRHEIVVRLVTRRVFLRDKLPQSILGDPCYWELRKSPRVTIKDALAARSTLGKMREQPTDEDDIVLIEDD